MARVNYAKLASKAVILPLLAMSLSGFCLQGSAAYAESLEATATPQATTTVESIQNNTTSAHADATETGVAMESVELAKDNSTSFDPPSHMKPPSPAPKPPGAPDDDIEEIITDRPDFTEATNTIAPGSLQLESGFTFERAGDGTRTWNFPEALFRVGILKTTELRFQAPQYFTIRGGSGHPTSGFGDIYVGMKQRLIDWKGFAVSAIPAMFLPTGAKSISSGQVDPEVKVVWSKDLNDRWSLTGMEAFYWPAEEGRKNFIFQQTVSLGYSVTEKMGMFLEYAGSFAKRGEPVHVIHSGITYSPTKRQQFDVHYGIGLSNDNPSFFIAGGYSIRIDYLKLFKN